MSNSYKHIPIHGITTCHSDKPYKVRANRRHRRAVKAAIRRGDELLPLKREVSDVWSFGKDGKMWWTRVRFGELFDKYMRK